jgi:hypothetical protein
VALAGKRVYHNGSIDTNFDPPEFPLDSTFKGTVSRDFSLLVFFHESVSPQPQSIQLRPFQIFSKIRGDIRESRCTTGISDTGGKFATGGKFFHHFR